MQCPLCLDSPLEPKFVGATEVDICPTCRGIWLDRGELDRLLGDAPPRDARRDEPRHDEPRRDDRRFDDRRFDDRRYDDRDERSDPRRPKGKQSKAKRLADLFEEVLDF